MAGLFATLGTALGGFAQGYAQSQQQALQQQLEQMKLQQAKDQSAADAAAFTAISGTGGQVQPVGQQPGADSGLLGGLTNLFKGIGGGQPQQQPAPMPGQPSVPRVALPPPQTQPGMAPPQPAPQPPQPPPQMASLQPVGGGQPQPPLTAPNNGGPDLTGAGPAIRASLSPQTPPGPPPGPGGTSPAGAGPGAGAPMPGQQQPGGGGMPAQLAAIKQRESGGNYNVGWTGVDLSGAPKDDTGFPIWKGAPGPQGPSHAAGAYQFEPATWRTYAKQLGITDFSPASQDRVAQLAFQTEGAAPWAASEAAPGHQGHQKPPIDNDQPPMQVVQQTAQRTVQDVQQQIPGQMSVQALAKQIEQANPGASPAVKFMALAQLQKLMAPSEAQQMRVLMQGQAQEFRMEMQMEQERFRQQQAIDARAARPEPTGTIVTGADGRSYTVRGNQAQPIQGLPEGTTTRMGGPQTAPPPASEVSFLANLLKAGGTLPPGLARNPALVSSVMKQLGEEGEDPQSFIAAHAGVRADTTSLAKMTAMRDATLSFEKTALRNLDQAMAFVHGDPESKLPEGNPARGQPSTTPTDWGPFVNRWVEEGEAFLGDPNVPASVTAMMTFANEYAKVMGGGSPGAPSTVSGRQEAAERFNPYFSRGQLDQIQAVAKVDMRNRETELNATVDDIKNRIGRQPGAAAPATPGAAPAQQPGQVPAAPGGAPASQEVIQNGWRYRKEGDSYVPVGPVQ